MGTSVYKIDESYESETVERKLSQPSEVRLEAEQTYSPTEVVPLRDSGFVKVWGVRLKSLHIEAHQLGYVRECHGTGKKKKMELFRITLPEAKLSKCMEGPLRGGKLINFRLRSGTHALRSDQYHRDGGSKECPCCETGQVEDVAHFLLHCRAFKKLRSEWLAALRDTEWGKLHWSEMYVTQDELGRCATLLGYPLNCVYSGGVEGRFPEQLSAMHLKIVYEARSLILEKASTKDVALEKLAKKEAAKKKQALSVAKNKAAAKVAVLLGVKEELRRGNTPGLHKFFSPVCQTAPKQSSSLSILIENRAGSLSPSGTYEC